MALLCLIVIHYVWEAGEVGHATQHITTSIKWHMKPASCFSPLPARYTNFTLCFLAKEATQNAE